MPGIHESLDLDGHVRLTRWLSRAAAEGITGVVRVPGNPGGTLKFKDGLVVVVESSGAPSVQALLVRGGRFSDEDWARDGGADHATSTIRIGPAHRRVLQSMANQDALFAMLTGSIDACVLERGSSMQHADQGEDGAALLADAFRKLDALALLPQAIHPHRDRLIARSAGKSGGPTDDAQAGTRPSETRKAILGCADGRRTARDIAFAAGRSLYAVTVEMSRMLAEGLLDEPSPPTGPDGAQSVRLVPRNPPPSPPDDAHVVAARSELPRRRSPADGEAGDASDQKTALFWRDFLHFGGRPGERD